MFSGLKKLLKIFTGGDAKRRKTPEKAPSAHSRKAETADILPKPQPPASPLPSSEVPSDAMDAVPKPPSSRPMTRNVKARAESEAATAEKPPEKASVKRLKQRKPKPESPPASKKNRHGLPVLDADADLSRVFEDIPDATSEKTPPPIQRRPRRRAIPVNRHGIPIIHEDMDISVFFRDPRNAKATPERRQPPAPPKRRTEESFEQLVEASLAGVDRDTLLREKTDHPAEGGPVTLRRLLRNYPLPQESLDLHGCSVEQALQKTETFIGKARKKGKRTLMIIVGKGLHSDGRPVLPDAVEGKIIDLKRRNQVLAFEWEKGKKRKSGALIVYLRG